MRNNIFYSNAICWKTTLIVLIAFMAISAKAWGQNGGEFTSEELVRLGFENVRWVENDSERIYTIENVAYKIQEEGIAKAIETIEKYRLPKGKNCKVIVTRLDIPE